MAKDEMEKNVVARRLTPTYRRRMTWPAVMLVIVVAVYATYSWLRSPSGYDWSYTADTEVVNLEVGPHRFAIPKNYLFKSGTRKDGVYNYFTVVLLMPEFKPYSEELKEEFHRGGAPLMFIDIGTRRSDPDITRQFNNRTQKYGHAELLSGSEALDLQQYAEPSPNGSDLFVKHDGERVTHFMDCKRRSLALSPSCKVTMDYSKDVVIDYNFKRIYLDRWKWIDEQVRTRLAEWERNGAQGKH